MKKKRLFTLALAGMITVCSAFSVGCTSNNDNKPEEDPTKANISVGTLDAGIGDAWLSNAARRFEKLYENSTDFQEGRTGVKINVTKSRSYDGQTLETASLTHDIYFTEGINYYKYVNGGKMEDLTGIMTEPLSEYGEDGTILSKIDPAYASFLKTKDNKYYAIPFYDSFYGFVYDLDLWNSKKLYISENGRFTNKDGNLSKGPDNEAGTSDDGLPATYDEFKKVMKQMRDLDITPFVCASNCMDDYIANLLFSFWVNEEGLDEMKLNYSFSGKSNDLITVKNGVVTKLPETEIKFENGYDLQKQAGKYYSLKFMQDVMCETPENYEIKTTHTNAQKSYVKGGITNNSPIGMIAEGSWWENESKPAFKQLTDEGLERHNYAVMPIPWSDASKVGGKQTRLSLSSSYGFVSSSSSNKKLALEFMKFLHTDAELSAFTTEVCMTRALNYDVSEADEANITTYAKSVLEIKKNQNVLYPYSSLEKVINNDILFANYSWAWCSNIDGGDYKSPWAYFRSASAPSAEKYFNGQYTYFSGKWNGIN